MPMIGKRLKIHEVTRDDGGLSPVHLVVAGDGAMSLASDDDREASALPEGALEAVMRRYGAPLEDGAKTTTVAAIDLRDGRSLRHVRHLARFDVIARDYLVYEAPDREPLCAMATTVAGALDHLARSLQR